MRLPVPGPRDLLHALERGTGLVEQLWEAVPRLFALLDAAEASVQRVGDILGRVDELLTAVDRTRESADTVVARTGAVVASADALVGRTDLHRLARSWQPGRRHHEVDVQRSHDVHARARHPRASVVGAPRARPS